VAAVVAAHRDERLAANWRNGRRRRLNGMLRRSRRSGSAQWTKGEGASKIDRAQRTRQTFATLLDPERITTPKVRGLGNASPNAFRRGLWEQRAREG